MTILYNCKHSGDQYRITKFNDGEPESSYLCTTTECDCPAGVRSMCRHREMLPYFLHRGFVGTGWWYDYDRGGWVDMRQDDETEPHSTTVSAPDFDSGDAGSNPAGVATTKITRVIVEPEQIEDRNILHIESAKQPYRKPNDGRRA